jgi:V-type H+-transporting ATPase subunit a
MMGGMAMYTGLLYNEFFAIPNNWFGTCFNIETRCSQETEGCNPIYLPKDCTDVNQGCVMDCVYPFGVDPAWYLSPLLLTFTNNIKMKLAVVIGVIHMAIGVIVKGANSVYFRNYLDFVFEVITGLIILLGLFGWMDLLIFSKWAYVMNPYSSDPKMQ